MELKLNHIYNGDVLEVLKTFSDECVDCVVTSPPYWSLRDYGIDGQIGLENDFQKYIDKLVDVFREVRRVLKSSGTLWLNLGDSYAYSGGTGSTGLKSKNFKQTTKPHRVKELKPKDLVGIPWRVAFALQKDGWYLRQDIIWAKPNPMPESIKDRFTKSHEYIFLFSKNKDYYFEQQLEKSSYKEKRPYGVVRDRLYGYDSKLSKLRGYKTKKGKTGLTEQHHGTDIQYGEFRNKRDVWFINTANYKDAHFAVFSEELVATPIKAGCPKGGVVLDPFCGSGTVAVVAKKLGRKYIGIELNPEYIKLANKRLAQQTFDF